MLEPLEELQEHVRRLAVERLVYVCNHLAPSWLPATAKVSLHRFEGRDNEQDLLQPPFNGDATLYAQHEYMYFKCKDCQVTQLVLC